MLSQAKAPEALRGFLWFSTASFLRTPLEGSVLDVMAPPLEEVVSGVVASVQKDGTADEFTGTSGGKVLTLSRRLGAGDTGFAPTLAARIVRFFSGEHHQPGERGWPCRVVIVN